MPRASCRKALCALVGSSVFAFSDDCFVWTDVTPAPPTRPLARYDAATAFDTAADTLVVFGGLDVDNNTLGDTWEFAGGVWTQIVTPGPSPRSGAAMIHDPIRGYSYMYGGVTANTGGSLLGDLWRYDAFANTWSQVSTVTSPGPWTWMEFAWDSVRSRIQAFGGWPLVQQLWEFDGTDWEMRVDGGPPGRSGHGFAFDPIRNRTYIFGGWDGTSARGDTWVYDPTLNQWTEVFPPTSPTPRVGCPMTFSAAFGKALLFGGFDPTRPSGEMWSFDGTNWQNLGGNPPYPRANCGLDVDGAGAPIVFGGGSYAGITYNDLWRHGVTAGGSWTPLSADPDRRDAHRLAYDSARDRVVLFGGRPPAWPSNDTWEYDGSQWHFRTSVGPPERRQYAMAYDSFRQRTYLFGGIGETASLNDTWSWDGNTWTQLFPANSPSPRGITSGMTYDSDRHVCVLFGGNLGTTRYNDTWEFDGTDWSLRATTGPTPRSAGGLAYDAGRRVTVLFGGIDASGRQGDTWEWDGATWTQRLVSGPSPRSPYWAAYDAAHRLTIIFGGLAADGSNLGDTWAWNGATWRQVASTGPRRRDSHHATYDSLRQSIVLYGGFYTDTNPPSTGVLRDLWRGTAIVQSGDVDVDGAVGLTDLAILLTNFGMPAGASAGDGDIDGDGDVDLTDLATLLTQFGLSCGG